MRSFLEEAQTHPQSIAAGFKAARNTIRFHSTEYRIITPSYHLAAPTQNPRDSWVIKN